MAPFLLLPHSLLFVPTKTNPTIQCPKSPKHEPFIQTFKPRYALKVSVGGDTTTTTTNGAPESPKPSRRVRKKETTSSPTSSSSSSTSTAPKKTRRSKKTQVENGAIEAKPEKGTGKTSTSPTKTRRSRKTQVENGSIETKLGKETESHPGVDDEIENYDDGIDFPYPSPPLVCFFGAAQKEFVPQVRVHDSPMHPDIYSEWKWLQWVPPDFARSLGGPSSNVAIAQVRLGGRAAFMGKVGDDEFGKAMVALMNEEKVQTRAVKFDKDAKTARTYMKLKFEDGRMKMEVVKEAAEDSFLASELNLAVLKEVNGIAKSMDFVTFHGDGFEFLQFKCGLNSDFDFDEFSLKIN